MTVPNVTQRSDQVKPAPGTNFWRSLLAGRRSLDRVPWIPIAIIVFLLLLPAIFADLITVHDPLRGVLRDRLTPPGRRRCAA